MHYQWVIFDADETLFHFDAAKGMSLMFERMGVPFSEQDYRDYQAQNQPLWTALQNGDITPEQLKHQRFAAWAERLNTTTQALNSSFFVAMADICQFLPGAQTLLEHLHGRVNMAIITNGFTELQSMRLEKLNISRYFEPIIISEQVGVAKPDRAIFEAAWQRMGQPDKREVLMVGDNIQADIYGGQQAGFDTCWLNRDGKAKPDHITPTFEIDHLDRLTARFAAEL